VKRFQLFSLSLAVVFGIGTYSIAPRSIAFNHNYGVTDSSSARLTLAEAKTKPLPESVKKAVFVDVTESISSTPIDRLKIVEAEEQEWSNGCLGLAQVDEICTQEIVSGWHVIVSDGKSTWTYRTDNSGREIRLEKLSL
jgi:hypothetical protein